MTMPSVLTSLATASGDTLAHVLQAREQQRLLLQQQMEQARKMAIEDARLRISMDGNRRANEALDLDRQRFTHAQAKDTEAAQRRKDEDDAKARQARNRAGVIDMVRQGGDQLDPEGRRLMALEAGLPVTSFDLPKTEKPFEQTLREQESLADMRARVRNRHRVTTTKPAKENVKAPQRFLDTISNRMGTAGFEDAEQAFKSIQDRWQAWRSTYPGLELNAVRAALQNLYGQRVGTGSGLDRLIQSVIQDALKSTPEP